VTDIVPVAVRRERKKVEVLARDFEGPFERTASITDLIVIVQITEINLILTHPRMLGWR